MRRIVRCGTAAIAIAVAGCASSSPPLAVAPPENISAPLNLCASAHAPPRSVAADAGYVQYAVTVTDAAGNPVSDLKESDFIAYSGSQLLPIRYFRENKGDAPQSIVIVMDESGSMLNKLVVRDPSALQSVREDIGEATKKLDRCDEVSVIAVGGHPASKVSTPPEDDGIRVIQPPTTDHELALSRMMEQLPWGQTPLYDGVTQGLQLIESAHYPNRAMIVVTDGLDNTSATEVDDVLYRAKKDRVPIYAIGIGDPNLPAGERAISVGVFVLGGVGDADRVDPKAIKALSVRSGGQYFIVPELSKDRGSTFVDAVDKVASALGRLYSIGLIAPTTGTSAEPPITIGLVNASVLQVNARKVESTPSAEAP